MDNILLFNVLRFLLKAIERTETQIAFHKNIKDHNYFSLK